MHSPRDDDTDAVSRVTYPWGQLVRRRGEATGAPAHVRFVDWLTHVGEVGGNVLVYSSAYLAAIAMVYVAIAMVVLDLPANLAPVIGGLVTFSIYASDRLKDVETDAETNPGRSAFVHRHRGKLLVLGAASYGLAVMLAVIGGPIALSITLLPGVFWVLYATDWIPGLLAQVSRLKEVLIVNTTVVALAWAASATLLPMSFTDAPFSASVWFVIGYFFLRSFTNTEIPNVRDVGGDRGAGISTLPVAFGIDRTRQILYGVDIFTLSLVGYGALAGHLPVFPAAALSIGVLYSLGVTSFIGRTEDEELLGLAAEFEYVIVGLALVPVVYGL